ncbi:MAG: hypothetical protein AAFY02_14245 [Pseudomonadota bacterium]
MASQTKNSDPSRWARLQAELEEMLANGECSVASVESGAVRKINATKVGLKRGKSVNIENINQYLIENDFEFDVAKRIYRRRQDLPNPDKGPKHSSNRMTRVVGTRISPEHMELFNRCAEKFDNKREALEHAIDLLAAEQGIDLDR